MRPQDEVKRGGIASMRDALATYLKATGLDRKAGTVEVFRVWTETVRAHSPSMTEHSRPVRYRNGLLTVEVTSAAHMHELASFQGDSFRRAANQALGTQRIRRVEFKLKH